jgi:hypothetical protein
MPKKTISLAACALLCGTAYADDRASSASNAHPNGPNNTVKRQTDAVNPGQEQIHGGISENPRSADFSIYSTFNVVATEVPSSPKLSGSPGGTAPVGTGPTSGRTAFLLQKEHDAAIRLLTTNVALRFKLSADGVHLNLAF